MAASIWSLIKAIPALVNLFKELQEIALKEQLAQIDQSAAEKKKDLEYIIALKQRAVRERNDEEVTRTHRLYIQFLSRL